MPFEVLNASPAATYIPPPELPDEPLWLGVLPAAAPSVVEDAGLRPPRSPVQAAIIATAKTPARTALTVIFTYMPPMLVKHQSKQDRFRVHGRPVKGK